uniref:Tetratricopeptide repeat protein 38 n=1 Tax=Fagus sylvatica TaxID=28930 RepID=A0A2N9EC03_FAGSY
MEGMKLDLWGYEVRTSSDSCISAINSYYHQVLSYGRERSVILEAPVHDKDCVLANILAAHFLCSSDPSRAPSHFQAAKSNRPSTRKQFSMPFSYLISQDRDDDVAVELHSKPGGAVCVVGMGKRWITYCYIALGQLFCGTMYSALLGLSGCYLLLKDFPRDLVSLKRAQVLCFYMGRADLSLDLVQQVLPVNQEENYIYGLLAFPLLELGRMADAEKAAKKGFEINKQDLWAQHALCHVLQYECHFKEAVEFMEGCSSSWSSCLSFILYTCIAVHLVMKLPLLCGPKTVNWYLEWHLDSLTIWALASTGKLSKAEALLKGLKSRFSRMSKKKQQLMQRGMLLAEALFEYGRGNEKQALELLGPDFDANNCKVIGASDEQIDVFNEVWYSMLLNTGQAVKGERL